MPRVALCRPSNTNDLLKRPTAVVTVGKFGLALFAHLADLGFPVTGIVQAQADADHFNRFGRHPHPRRFPNLQFTHPDKEFIHAGISTDIVRSRSPVDMTSSFSEGLRDKRMLVFTTPSEHAAKTAAAIRDAETLDPHVPIISVTKGFAHDRRERLVFITAILEALLPKNPIFYAGGPAFADGIVRKDITVMNLVSRRHPKRAPVLARLWNQPGSKLRLDPAEDAVAIELIGILKNPIAIAIGACFGLGYEVDNTSAALLYLGRREIKEFGLRSGATLEGFEAFAFEDLTMTAFSPKSRNFKLGFLYGKTWREHGRPPNEEEISAVLGGAVAEGIPTIRQVRPLLDQIRDYPFPVLRFVYDLLFHQRDPLEFAGLLLSQRNPLPPLRAVHERIFNFSHAEL